MPRKSASSLAYDVTGAGTRLKPPPDLNELERAEFVSLILALPPDHFTAADLSTVAAYVRAVVAERRAAGELDAAPVIEGKPSPWLQVWLGQLRACTTLARRLKLNPAGHQPSKSAGEQALPTSYYDRLDLERRDEPEPN
jgi:hypothetical protein